MFWHIQMCKFAQRGNILLQAPGLLEFAEKRGEPCKLCTHTNRRGEDGDDDEDDGDAGDDEDGDDDDDD